MNANRTGSDDVKNPHKWETGPHPETGTHQDNTYTTDFSNSSRQVNWLTVHEFVGALRRGPGNDWPMLGTPPGAASTHNDPESGDRAVLRRQRSIGHLRMDLIPGGRCRSVTWRVPLLIGQPVAREWRRLNEFYAGTRGLRAGGVVTDVDRSDELRELYAQDNPDGAELLDDIKSGSAGSSPSPILTT